MTARAILEHFVSITKWIDAQDSVDRIVIGDPEKDVSRIGVTWMSTFANVREAVSRGLDLLITHEPTFWTHMNELATVESWPVGSPKRETAERKRRFIEEHGLTILRVHDAWDAMPETGIPWAWARFLDLGTRPAAVSDNSFQHRYDIAPVALDALAHRVAAKTAELGEPAVQVVGSGDRGVSKVGIGTGCYCDLEVFLELGCDVSIVCDDSNWYWEGIAFAADHDHPLIRVNHGVSEEPGVIALTEYVNRAFRGVSAEHIPCRAPFRLVPLG